MLSTRQRCTCLNSF